MTVFRPVGIRLERKKDPSLLNWNLKRPYSPEKVRVAISRNSSPCVKEGETVKVGQKIAEPKSAEGVTVHASLAGTVQAITAGTNGETFLSIVSQKGGEARSESRVPEARKDWEQLSAEELLQIFQHSGLVTTDPAAEPLHSKLRKHSAARTLIVNGCEPEPYVTCEQVLLMAHAVEVLKGAELIRKAAGAEKVLFAFEKDNNEIKELIQSKIFFLKWEHAEIRTVPALYPQGNESTLLQNWFAGREDEAVVVPASTAFAAYEAVINQKPFYERMVTVGGECVVEPRSLWLPLGLSFRDAIQACKGLMREPSKVLRGGPMMGIMEADLDVPVTPATTAILALPKEVAREAPEEPCIRCNKCVDECPVGLLPALITLAAEQREFDVAADLDVEACTECGNCGYVCPSKRPMLQRLREARGRSGESNFVAAGACHA